MDWVFNGLPVHSLLVHFTVVIIPAAALAVVVAALWPAARRWLGIATPLLALAALIVVPLAASAGEWLYAHVEHTAAAQAHQAIGKSILPWAIALFVVAALQWAWYRFGNKAPTGSGFLSRRGVRRGVAVVLLAVALVSAVGSVVTVVKVGEAGTAAVWEGRLDTTP